MNTKKYKIYKDRTAKPLDNEVMGTKNENKVTALKFEIPDEYNNWNKRIVFITPEGKPWYYLENDAVSLINEITQYGEVDAYIWLTEHANNQEESPGDFRSKIFTLTFNDNENTDNYEPSPEQVDGFNRLITVLNEELEEIRALESTIEQAEQSREQRTNEAINNIVDMTESYNQNAEEKNNAFNTNASQKTNDFDSHVEDKIDDFNDNASEKTETLNQIAEGIEDMTTAIQFASFEVDNDMHLNIIQAERMPNTNFIFNPETGRLGVRIYNG
ncbi:MAG: hypothetical protein IKE01_06670 [Clostridia bacterium]|nr:hypothetical protein [Clostridia bacterium]